MFEALKLVESLRVPPVSALEAAIAAGEAEDRAAVREAETKRARAAERAEQVAAADVVFGGPAAEIRRLQPSLMTLNDEVADLEAQLARVTAKRDHIRSLVGYWADKQMLADDMVKRSITEPDPLEAASARAADAFRQVAEGRMVLEQSRRSLRARLGAR